MFFRRLICSVIAGLFLFAAPALASATSLVVNGRTLATEIPPRIEKGRLMVPLRTAAEALDASVYYDSFTREVAVAKKNTRITLTIDSPWAKISDLTATLDVPPKIVAGRTLVPLRFLGESLGVNVAWNPVAGAAYLSETLLHLPGWTKPITTAPPTLYQEGKRVGVKLYRPAYDYVEAETRVDFELRDLKNVAEVVIVVEKGNERSDQPFTAAGGVCSGQLWLPFGPGEYRVTVCSPPRDNNLQGWVGFKVRNTGRQDFRSLAPIDWVDWDQTEVLHLARELYVKDQTATVTAIHDWVAQNIDYDVATSRSVNIPQKRASEVLRSRSGVCEHFSRLLAALCRANAIPATIVQGYLRREGESWPAEPNHAWNEVLVNGRWVTVDATWDAGYIEGSRFVKSFSRTYLDPDPSVLASTHRKQY